MCTRRQTCTPRSTIQFSVKLPVSLGRDTWEDERDRAAEEGQEGKRETHFCSIYSIYSLYRFRSNESRWLSKSIMIKGEKDSLIYLPFSIRAFAFLMHNPKFQLHFPVIRMEANGNPKDYWSMNLGRETCIVSGLWIVENIVPTARPAISRAASRRAENGWTKEIDLWCRPKYSEHLRDSWGTRQPTRSESHNYSCLEA